MPQLLSQPEGKPTLMGGTIARIDRVRDEMSIRPFGGGKVRVLFDPRTQIYRDGTIASARDLQNGDRVYVDTMLAGKDIFAKTVRVVTQNTAGQSLGQVVTYDAAKGELVVHDPIAAENLRVRMLAGTVVSRQGHILPSFDLPEGTLVSVVFVPGNAGSPVAREVSILATPGNEFVFVGKVVHLDLHLGLMVVVDPRDRKTYEISFDSAKIAVSESLHEGSMVEVTTRFDGLHYLASAIRVDATPGP